MAIVAFGVGLIVAAVGFIGAISLQLLNMKKMMDMDFESGFGGFFKRFGAAAVFGFIGAVGGILFVASLILNAIEHFSA